MLFVWTSYMVRLAFISCSFELHIWFNMKITEVALLLAWTPVESSEMEPPLVYSHTVLGFPSFSIEFPSPLAPFRVSWKGVRNVKPSTIENV